MKRILIIVAFLMLLNVPLILGEDIAYVVPDVSDANFEVISSIENLGFSYELIEESEITNFDNYGMILLWDDYLDNVDLIPIGEKPILVANLNQVDDLNLANSISSRVNSGVEYGIIDQGGELTSGLSSPFQIYDESLTQLYYLPKLPHRALGFRRVVHKNSFDQNIILGTINEGGLLYDKSISNSRVLFFSLTNTAKWTSESRLLFENSINWVLIGEDFDLDGFFGDADCNDNDPLINPDATEIAYDGVDNDCDGFDLTDVDLDGFDSEIISGLDCNDNDPLINPDANEIIDGIDQNCVNDRPFLISDIPDVGMEEDIDLIDVIDLRDYFKDYEDSLDFTFLGNDDVDVIIENGLVSFYPHENFFGEDEVIFTATDGDLSIDSNIVQIIVSDLNEPPILENDNCLRNINEDEEYECDLVISDEESDDYEVNILENNNIVCTYEGSKLSYISDQDYNGEASCLIEINDEFGKNEYLFEFNIENTFDNPGIGSFDPNLDNLIIYDDESKDFSLGVNDPDNSENSFIDWYLNGVYILSGEEFNFSSDVGSYELVAVVGDIGFCDLDYICDGSCGECTLDETCNLGECEVEIDPCLGKEIGDASCDGSISALDASIVAGVVSGNDQVPEDICLYDVNLDLELTTEDTSLISRIAVGLDESPGVCGEEVIYEENLLNRKTWNIEVQKRPPEYIISSSEINIADISDRCSIESDEIEFEIRDPNDFEEFFINEELEVRAIFENDFEEDLRYDVDFYLYDFTENKVIDEIDERIKVKKGSNENSRVQFYFEDDLDDGNSYGVVVIVKSEGNLCSEDYRNIEISRDDHDIRINKIKIDNSCKILDIKVDFDNLGNEDEDITLKIQSELFNDIIDVFELEGFDNDIGSESRSFTIPIDREGSFDIQFDFYAEDYHLKEKRNIDISCGGKSNELEINEEELDPIKISFESEEVTGIDISNKENYIVIFVFLITLFLLLIYLANILSLLPK